MKLIIDIDDNVFTRLFDNGVDTSSEDRKVIDRAVRNGTSYKERPTGKWIEHYSKELSDKGFYLCSRCKAGFQRYERGVRHSDLPWIDGQKYELHRIDNFCPNCGTDMRSGKE